MVWTRLMLAFALVLMFALSDSGAAGSQRQMRKAQKLLERIELVDGAGSGLDADTLRGLAPDQLGGDTLNQILTQVTNLTAAIGSLGPRRASDIVALEAPFFTDCLPQVAGAAKFTTIVTPAGTEDPFTIPAGKVLVVTSAHILGFSGPASSNVQTRLFTVASSGTALFARQEAVTDASGRVNMYYTFPTGAVIASGAAVCVNDSAGMTLTGELYGFLAADE